MFHSRVTKFISAAHHNGPEGNKCHNNHGHDWQVIVEFRYPEESLDEFGWGPEFSTIKGIIESYDHGVGGDLNERLAPEPPSAEVFARRLYNELEAACGRPPYFVEVKEGHGNSLRYFR